MVGSRCGVARFARGCSWFVAGAVVLASASSARAQEWSPSAVVSGASTDEWFGRAISVNGGSMLVGSSSERDTNGGTGTGAAYVFSGADWSTVARLVPDAGAGMREYSFGGAVALDGDTALVGTTHIDPAGVYVFARSEGTWTQQQRLFEAGVETFGYRLALRGDVAVLAAPKDGADVGKASVYTKTAGAWTKTQDLKASDAAESDFFGLSLAFDGQVAVLGAPGNALFPGARTGVYVYALREGLFSEQARLALPGPPELNFGASVALAGDTLMVGAPPQTDATSNGQALVFVRSGASWSLQQTLTVIDEEHFGTEVALQGETAWVMASTRMQRSLYVFKRANGVWSQTQRLEFGASTLGTSAPAVYGGTLAVGVQNNDVPGAIHVFTNPAEPGPGGAPDAGGGSGSDSGGCAVSGASGPGSTLAAALITSALLGAGRARRRRESAR